MADVTVLLPLYNAERYVGAAIESILGQSYRDFELLIVDDGSTDRSPAIVASYRDPRIRVLRQPENLGLSAALNRGLAEARGALVARQDADDVSHPRRLERQVLALGRQTDLALVGCQARAIDADGRSLADVHRPLDGASIRWYALFDNPFIHSSVVFRRRVVWDELGGFDAAFDPYSQDYALWWRVIERYGVLNLRERLLTYRVSPSSIIGAVEASGRTDVYRRRFESVVRTLVTRHLQACFGVDVVSDDDAAVLSGFVLGIDVATLPRFLALFGDLLRRFETRHPDSRRSRAFRRTLARQFDAIAYRVRPPSRAAAVDTYVAAIRARPDLIWALPWLRALALCTLGLRGRDRVARWRHSWTGSST